MCKVFYQHVLVSVAAVCKVFYQHVLVSVVYWYMSRVWSFTSMYNFQWLLCVYCLLPACISYIL